MEKGREGGLNGKEEEERQRLRGVGMEGNQEGMRRRTAVGRF